MMKSTPPTTVPGAVEYGEETTDVVTGSVATDSLHFMERLNRRCAQAWTTVRAGMVGLRTLQQRTEGRASSVYSSSTLALHEVYSIDFIVQSVEGLQASTTSSQQDMSAVESLRSAVSSSTAHLYRTTAGEPAQPASTPAVSSTHENRPTGHAGHPGPPPGLNGMSATAAAGPHPPATGGQAQDRRGNSRGGRGRGGGRGGQHRFRGGGRRGHGPRHGNDRLNRHHDNRSDERNGPNHQDRRDGQSRQSPGASVAPTKTLRAPALALRVIM